MTSRALANKLSNFNRLALRRQYGALAYEVEELREQVDSGFLLTEETTRTHHEAIVTPSSYKAPGAKEPELLSYGACLMLGFTVNDSQAFRRVKIPTYFSSDLKMHLHWSKSGDQNEEGKFARWRVSYLIVSGNNNDINVAPSTVEFETAYASNGTTSRIIYRSPDLVLDGAVAGYYLSLKVEAITPQGIAMASKPSLFSADVTYKETIN